LARDVVAIKSALRDYEALGAGCERCGRTGPLVVRRDKRAPTLARRVRFVCRDGCTGGGRDAHATVAMSRARLARVMERTW
jgi:hypothetical protein